MQQPLVTIVTPSYNQGQFIEETIQSVLSQDYPHIEYIVVDGGSTDETLSILRKYDKQLKWISEPDEGQSDAINKGWRMGSGEIWAWLNSDDCYEPGAVKTAVDLFMSMPHVGVVYGDLKTVDNSGDFLGLLTAGSGGLQRLRWFGQHVMQPASFMRADCVKQAGFINRTLKAKMDYDFYIRMAQVAPLYYHSQVFARFRVYSETKSMSNLNRNWKEKLWVLKKYNNLWFVSPVFLQYLRFRLFQRLPPFLQNGLRKRRGFPRDLIQLEVKLKK